MPAASNEKIALVIEKVLEKKSSAREGSIRVDFSRRHPHLYHAKVSGNHVKLKVGIGPEHPRFNDVLDRMAHSVSDLYHGALIGQALISTERRMRA